MTRGSVGRRVTAAALLVAALVAVDVGAHRVRRAVDLTADRSLTLSDQTREVVASVDEPVRLVALVRANERRAEASALLTRYRRLNRHITWEILDPESSPGELRRLEMDPVVDAVAAASGDRVERGPTITEQDLTSALARVVRDEKPTVCFTTGSGEPSIDDSTEDGLSTATAVLRSNGYVVQTLDLVTADEVPAECDAVAVVAPTAPRLAGADVVSRWLEEGHHLLVMADASTPVEPVDALLVPWGVGIRKGVLLEGDEDFRVADDASTPLVREYRTSNPIARRLPPTFFPGAVGLIERDVPAGTVKPVVAELAQTSDLSYLETGDPLAAAFDPNSDVVGPVTLVAASDSSEVVDRTRVRRTRVVATADADWVTNAFVGDAGNSVLLVRALDWMTLDEDLVSVSANLPRVRPLAVTPSKLTYARILTAGVIPALFLLVGAFTWALRRSR